MTVGDTDECPFCAVMLAVPASIAGADVDDLEHARRYLAVAEASASRWDGTAWDAAVLEARAHIVRAEGRPQEFEAMVAEAGRRFAASGQPLDAQRCRAATGGLRREVTPA